MPSVEFLDTEVLTNVPIPSAAQKACKYAVSMAFSGTLSNNVRTGERFHISAAPQGFAIRLQ